MYIFGWILGWEVSTLGMQIRTRLDEFYKKDF